VLRRQILDRPDDAIDKLAKLMSDEDLRHKLGKNGRNQVLKKFSTDIIVKQYEEIYQSVLGLEKRTTETYVN